MFHGTREQETKVAYICADNQLHITKSVPAKDGTLLAWGQASENWSCWLSDKTDGAKQQDRKGWGVKITHMLKNILWTCANYAPFAF